MDLRCFGGPGVSLASARPSHARSLKLSPFFNSFSELSLNGKLRGGPISSLAQSKAVRRETCGSTGLLLPESR
jgi:hypothetical protein